MKIEDLRAVMLDVPLKKAYSIASRDIRSARLVLLEIRTKEGVYGYGSAAPCREVTGESPEDSLRELNSDGLKTLLIGRDPISFLSLSDELAGVLPDVPAARAAVEIALLDCVGKHLGMPVYDILGCRVKPLPTSVTVGICSPEETLRQVEEYRAAGFRFIKIKIGRSPEEDIERLIKIREAFGNTLELRVDMNQGYTMEDFRYFFQKTEQFRLELLEQPFPVQQTHLVDLLEPSVKKILAADENLQSPADALRLLQGPEKFGIFNIKLMKCGGPRDAARIADLAALGGVKLMWGCNDESVLSITAALHSALACPATAFLDLDGSFDLAEDPCGGGFEVREGILYPLSRPGYGVDVEIR
ncbi:MAG: dipeptide epimerase [Spirochaetales bacterium]|nr:dipeptide epimerase [Spirochaetales bacterium]